LFFQAEDEGVALTVAAYLDEETHIPPPRLVIFLAVLLLFTTFLISLLTPVCSALFT